MERSMKKILVLLAALVLVLAMAGCSQSVDSAPSLNEALAAEGTQTIKLTEDLVLTEPLVVNGNKIITGSHTITLNITEAAEGEEGPAFSLLGCPKLTAEDWSADAAVLQVAEGASLTLEGDIIIDGAGVSNGVVALKGATLTLTGNAIVQNGKDCSIYICEDATLNVSGGSVLTSLNHGVVNMGTMNVTGGTLSGAEKGAVIYNAGALDISEGVITAGGVHNIYAAAGTVNVTGGKIDWAAKDGIVVASGASATVTGGAIENCGTHGLCNSGTMETGAINLYECGIANNAGGTLNMTDTTVEISPVYCLANMGGTVTATNFSALSCDVTSVCNFAGDMTLENLTVTGSRAGNISNESGNLIVNTATLGLCREKPINVGSGVARMDNITVEGTTGEYFGAYIYGGEFYLSNSTISFINYSALRADGKCYVELNNVSVDDTMASGIWSRGATIVANKLTLNNIRGHAINNSGGTVTITDLKATDIGKNAIIQDNGVTTLNGASFQNVGDQGAYVKNGKLIINGGWFDNIAQNGVYSVPTGDSEVILRDVTYSRVTKYGLNNGDTLSAENVTILCNSGTGILNKKLMYLKNVEVKSPAKDCIYNDTKGELYAVNVTVRNAGEKSTPVFNRGNLIITEMNIIGSHNNGLYNNGGRVEGQGLHISEVAKYGIYNKGGTIKTLTDVEITGTGDHCINNEKGDFVASNLVLSDPQGAKSNVIYNTGDMELTGLTANGGKSHSIFNKGTIIGTDFVINNPGEVGFNNNEGGLADITNLTVNGGTHGVYNISQMRLNGANLNDAKNNGIFNKEGAMELHGTLTVTGSTEHGLCNNAGTIIGDADLIVKDAGKNGIYNVSGGSVTLGNVDINGANYGISNSGTLNAESIVTKHTYTNGIHNSNTLNTTGNVSISDVYGATTGDNHGNGIYNTKNMTIGGDLTIDSITAKGHTGNSSNNAIFNRGTLTANGSVTIGDVTAGHAIIGTAGSINFPGTVTVNGTVGKDNIIYFYSGAKTATFGNLVKTSDVAKVVLKADGSTQVNVAAGNLVGKSKDVVVANGNAVVTLNNVAITGGNNALHGAGGDIVANNVTINGSTIGMNIRNANSQITVQGVSSISNTTHGSAVHVNSKGKLSIEGALTIDCTSGQNGVKVYNGSTLALVGSGSLTINNPRIGISTDAGAIVTGDAGTAITINNAAADGFAIENYGTITMNGTVSGTGADSNDNALFKMLNNATFGALNVPTASAREALRAEKSAVVTVNGGTINGSSKDVIVASETSVINVNNVTINGGNNALYGAGGDINATSVTIDGSTIGVNIRNAASEVTVSGASVISNTTHGSAVHVNKGGTLNISGGSLTINCISGQNGVKVYADSTLALASGGSLIINNPKTGINTDAGAIVTGDAGTSITVNGAAADGYAIENYGTITMNGTVTGTGADSSANALFKMMNNATFGALNVPAASAREALRAEKEAVVTVNGGTINGSSKDVIVATAGTVINVNNVSVIGGNNALYAVGGTINGSTVTVNGSTIGINQSNDSSVVTLSGTNTISNTTHGTCMHIRGTLTLNEGATLTVQDPANVGFKIYATGDLTLKDGATLNIVNCQKGWNVEAGSKFNRSETSTVTVNGEPA